MTENGFFYQPRRSSRHPALYITDAEFADDIALLSDILIKAQSLISAHESVANRSGLYINESKSECMSINTYNNIEIKTQEWRGVDSLEQNEN